MFALTTGHYSFLPSHHHPALPAPKRLLVEGFEFPAGFLENSCSAFLQPCLHLSKQICRVLSPGLLFPSCPGRGGSRACLLGLELPSTPLGPSSKLVFSGG